MADRAPHGVDVDVEACDLEALHDHMPRHLQAHGAQANHAGALHWITCIAHLTLENGSLLRSQLRP
jgi:hypothetical protein